MDSPGAGLGESAHLALPARGSLPDIFVNLLAYIPLGFLLELSLRPRLRLTAAVIVSFIAGTALSFGMEVLQSWLPSRVPSLLDLLTNGAGTLAGALLASGMASGSVTGRHLKQWRDRRFAPGTLSNMALAVVLMWAAAELAPFAPSLDIGNLRAGLRPLGNTLRHPDSFLPLKAAVAGLEIFAVGVLVRIIVRDSFLPLFGGFSLAVLILKIPVIGQSLSLEALAGWLAAMAMLTILTWERLGGLASLGILGLVSARVLSDSLPGSGLTLAAFNWTPFAGQVGKLSGMVDMTETIWPYFGMGVLARMMTGWRWRPLVALLGVLSIVSLAGWLEWRQIRIPGRTPDITDVLLASLSWLSAWLITRKDPVRAMAAKPGLSAADQPGDSFPEREKPRPLRWLKPGVALLVGAAVFSLGLAGWMAGGKMKMESDDKGRAMLPSPENLAPIYLPGFRMSHPRLPHPSAADILRLRTENPGWLDHMRRLAAGGEGHYEAVIVMAYIEPGSQDLALLHKRLMAERYHYRGHVQAKPVAQAYDWLYQQWNDAQRAALQEKLAEGVGYITNFIRQERLSPYNVFLYNAPLQGLMAANLALYGDDPRGELYMRFTYDLWKHRVLPVWRQVMGKNGGWHEGGEYIGIGIGQAVYQLPAMWRSATGEDLFKSEPGIRGFLDFAVYRTRPDGTHFRWGDAGFFDKIVSDVIPLALEYRHRAAYNLRPPKPRPTPSAWPWGPLTDASLLASGASPAPPLSRLFDGLGLVVARSGWGPDDTYLSFKAGDNYWSHSHLDQGAFTLYKGGELAIDSGFYGPKYGSDHHMNYSYQSIAHNLVTVTDPADNAPVRGKEIRQIANDGGQRRMGSGWGLESAPLDLSDWQEKQALYHTGTLRRYYEGRDMVVAVGDVTPAYTNSSSAAGEFSHRTRRVERLWRTLAYDRQNDVVVIYDNVVASRAEFRKRWLLHTQSRPEIRGDEFSITLPATPARHQSGGHLLGRVVFPERAAIDPVGGPGREFWADGKNYDENGAIWDAIRRKGGLAEPGSWRLEISPRGPSEQDEFLVVLVPRISAGQAMPGIRRLTRGMEKGVEIAGPVRTVRWWFHPEHSAVRMEIAGLPAIDIAAMDAGESERGVWARLRHWWKQR